jgi:hypothetical protein
MEESRVLVIESLSEGGRYGVCLSLERAISSPNPDAIDRCKHNSVTVPYLEYHYPKYSPDPRFIWYKQRLVKLDKALP